ncbi:hypothetical protein I5C00_09870, partial [Staphylococcus aureus]|nr:hypothetical protein [Staphylococcus aureus]
MKSRKLAITALLIAINVVLSSIIIIPLGPVKACLLYTSPSPRDMRRSR